MKSIRVSEASSIRGSNAAATAAEVRSKPKAMWQAPISASVASGSGRSPSSRTSAGIAAVMSSGSFARSISGTPSSRPTAAHETPETVWLWIFVSPPAATSGKRP